MSYNPFPSESIYYHEFPYRICISKKSVANASSQYKLAYKQRLYHELSDFFMNSPNKSRVRYNGFNVYFQEYELFVETLHMFSELVDRCMGPVSDEHLVMLRDKTYSLDVRPNIYYRRYDSKISVFSPYYRGGLSQTRRLAAEIRDFLKNQFDQNTIRMQRQWTLGTELYINYDEWMSIYPFFKLSFPDAKVKLVRCFLYDK